MTGSPPPYEPFAHRFSNPGVEDCFTCPACFQDHNGAAASITQCTKCLRAIRCYVTDQPAAVCELVEPGEPDGAP